MGQIHHNKEAEINQNKYSYVIVFIILTYCFITKLTAIAMNGQIRIQVISVYMYSSQSTLYNASGI